MLYTGNCLGGYFIRKPPILNGLLFLLKIYVEKILINDQPTIKYEIKHRSITMEFKKKITLSLSLLLCTGSITFVNATPNCAEVTEKNDVQFLETLSSEIKKIIDDNTKVVDRLKDEKDTTPLSVHVAFMDEQLDILNKIIASLKERLAQHKDPFSMQYRALKLNDYLPILYMKIQKVSESMKKLMKTQTDVKVLPKLFVQLVLNDLLRFLKSVEGFLIKDQTANI